MSGKWSDLVGCYFTGHGHVYLCDSYDPNQGLWMTPVIVREDESDMFPPSRAVGWVIKNFEIIFEQKRDSNMPVIIIVAKTKRAARSSFI